MAIDTADMDLGMAMAVDTPIMPIPTTARGPLMLSPRPKLTPPSFITTMDMASPMLAMDMGMYLDMAMAMDTDIMDTPMPMPTTLMLSPRPKLTPTYKYIYIYIYKHTWVKLNIYF